MWPVGALWNWIRGTLLLLYLAALVRSAWLAEDADLIGKLREEIWSSGMMVSTVRKGKKTEGEKFQGYFDFRRLLRNLPSHQILALFRGGGLLPWIGIVIVLQNIVSSLFNSHLSDSFHGWLYVFGFGVVGGMMLRERYGACAPARAP